MARAVGDEKSLIYGRGLSWYCWWCAISEVQGEVPPVMFFGFISPMNTTYCWYSCPIFGPFVVVPKTNFSSLNQDPPFVPCLQLVFYLVLPFYLVSLVLWTFFGGTNRGSWQLTPHAEDAHHSPLPVAQSLGCNSPRLLMLLVLLK
jgi:hypothetical protein